MMGVIVRHVTSSEGDQRRKCPRVVLEEGERGRDNCYPSMGSLLEINSRARPSSTSARPSHVSNSATTKTLFK